MRLDGRVGSWGGAGGGGADGVAGQLLAGLHGFLRLDALRRTLADSAAASLFQRMQREVPRGGGGLGDLG